MITLTIAIPTYNRSRFLIECLDSVIGQIESDVDIVVSDNASTDDTCLIVQEYLKYPFIKYFKNGENRGMDYNFYNCLQKSDGEYIHLMSDDDIMLPGTIKAILACIRKEKPDLIHLNTCGVSDEGSSQFAYSKPRLSFSDDFITYDKDEFLASIGIFITYLSALVLKNELVREIKDLQKYFGTFFLQSHAALLSTVGNKKLVILEHNSVSARGGNTGGYNLYQVWVNNYKKLLFETGVKAGYNSTKIKKLFIQSMKTSIRGFILEFRMRNTGFDLKNRKLLIVNTFQYPSIWFKVYPIAFTPVFILTALRRLKGKIKTKIKRKV